MKRQKIVLIKVISVIAGITALFYLSGGIAAFLSGLIITHSSMFGDPILSKLPFGLFITGSIYTIIGLFALIATFGLFRYRNWARSYWLWITVAIFLLATLDFVRNLYISFDLFDLFEPIFALSVAVISWLFLSKSEIKELFKQSI